MMLRKLGDSSESFKYQETMGTTWAVLKCNLKNVHGVMRKCKMKHQGTLGEFAF